jgi:hypothetical protein
VHAALDFDIYRLAYLSGFEKAYAVYIRQRDMDALL